MKLFEMISRYAILLGLAFGLARPLPQVPAPAQPKTAPYHSYLPEISKQFDFLSTGPEGGEIPSFAINPLNSMEMYAGTWGGGVYKSVDGGANWQPSSSGLIDYYIQSLAIDPKTPSTIYAGLYGDGVYKSIDGGESWNPTGPGLNSNPIVYDIQVDPQNPNILYAGTRSLTPVFAPPYGGGAYKSIDGGNTWMAINNGLAEDWVYSLAIDPSTPSTVYAALHTAGVSKTTDRGVTWNSINAGVDDTSGRSVVVDPLHPQTVYLGVWHGGGVYKTTNGGSSWQAVQNGLSGVKIYKLIKDPIDTNIIYAVNARGIVKSSNAGGSWSGIGYANDFVPSLAVDPINHDVVFTGVMGVGLLRSANGGASWSFSQHGLRAAIVASLAQSSGMLYAGLAGNGIARSTDGGNSWLSEGNGVGDYWVNVIAVNPSNSQVIYAGTDRAGVFKTTNGGNSWSSMSSGLANVSGAKNISPKPYRHFPPDFQQTIEDDDPLMPGALSPKTVTADTSYSVLSIGFDQHNPAIVYLGTDNSGVFKSINSGGSWSLTSLTGKPIYDLVLDWVNPNFVYAATSGASSTLWKSLDNGSTWNVYNQGIQGLTMNQLIIDPSDANHLYAGTSDGVFQSINGGTSWQRFGLAGQNVNSVALTPGGLSAATSAGLQITTDGGAHWLGRKTEAPNLDLRALQLSSRDGKTLILGSFGRGVLLDSADIH
jgi:photosystem II stability/assembly factor-like uncharacterized protein